MQNNLHTPKHAAKAGGNVLKGCLGCLGLIVIGIILLLVFVFTGTKEVKEMAVSDIGSIIENPESFTNQLVSEGVNAVHSEIEAAGITSENSDIKITGRSISIENGVGAAKISGNITPIAEGGEKIPFEMIYTRSSKDAEWQFSAIELNPVPEIGDEE